MYTVNILKDQLYCRGCLQEMIETRNIEILKGGIFGFFYFLCTYSTLLHLRPLRFHCVGGCWDKTQDYCDFCIDTARRSNHSASTVDFIHTRLDLTHTRLDLLIQTRKDLIHKARSHPGIEI
jgi:hypothetical protein